MVASTTFSEIFFIIKRAPLRNWGGLKLRRRIVGETTEDYGWYSWYIYKFLEKQLKIYVFIFNNNSNAWQKLQINFNNLPYICGC